MPPTLSLPIPTHDLFAWHRALRAANTREQDGVLVVEAVLSRQALALAFVIGTFMDSDGTTPARWSPGLDRLSDALGYPASDHRKAVGRLLSELQKAGYLIVTSRPGRFTPNLYTAAVPAHRAAPATSRPDEAAAGQGTEPGTGQGAGGPAEPPTPVSEPVPGAAHAPQQGTAAAALTPLNRALAAAPVPANAGINAAQPSRVFTPPFPAATAASGDGAAVDPPGAGSASGLPDTTATMRLFAAALSGMPPAAAHALMNAVLDLPNRYELAEQVNALCALGAADKVVAELARPYHQARKPAAVAAARVRALWNAYGRPSSQ